MRLPGAEDRTVIVGSTGSGKTVFEVWMLSKYDWQTRPVYILDTKRTSLLGQLPSHKTQLSSNPPRRPGLHLIRPRLDEDYARRLEEFLWAVFQKGDAILVVDEGMSIPKNSFAFRAMLQQGREKQLTMITCSQRPVKLTKEVFSEATFWAIFRLSMHADRDTVSKEVPPEVYTPKTRLPKRRCIWYDVEEWEAVPLLPVPPPREIVKRFYDARKSQSRVV